MVQIRNVPTEFLHRRLKARAALEGMSMSDYIVHEVGKALDRPTRAEVLERSANPTRPPAEAGSGRPDSGGTRRAVIVLDASGLVELILKTSSGLLLAERPCIERRRCSDRNIAPIA